MRHRRGLLMGWGLTAAIVTGLGLVAEKVQAETTIAYCDTESFAINVYRTGAADTPDSELKIRIYYRTDEITFLDTPADRAPNPEGYDYTNQLGENDWKLFVPNSEASQCSLTRDGELMESGDVIQREPSSTGGV